MASVFQKKISNPWIRQRPWIFLLVTTILLICSVTLIVDWLRGQDDFVGLAFALFFIVLSVFTLRAWMAIRK